VAKGRGWAIATDESKDPKWKKVITGAGFAIVNPPGIILAAIRAQALTVVDADEIKARLEQRRFKMNFASFASLI
jgi:F0F1-type ATP synthase epsilon subunit